MKYLLLTILIASFIPTEITYSKMEETIKMGGCVLDKCPNHWLKNYTGMKYYAKYEEDSKEYWRAYCNQMLNTKFECK